MGVKTRGYFKRMMSASVIPKQTLFKTKVSKKKTPVDFNFIKKMIKKNEYISKYSKNNKRNKDSLSYLVDDSVKMSQSDCIKLGLCVEKVLSDIIQEKNPALENIRPSNEKGKHERDHLFIDENNKTIVYSELKSNLCLDTEKCKATVMKCKTVSEELKKEYPGYYLKWCLLGLRYTESNQIHPNIMNKFSCIKDNVFGVNQYLDTLGVNIRFSDNEWKLFINEIAKKFK